MRISLQCQCGALLEFDGGSAPYAELEFFGAAHRKLGHRRMRVATKGEDVGPAHRRPVECRTVTDEINVLSADFFLEKL